MMAYLVRRTILAFFTVFSISVIAFTMIQLPAGDFADIYIASLTGGGQRTGMLSPEDAVEVEKVLRAKWGLDRPLVIQYWSWASRMVVGDFGQSLDQRRPVIEVIGDRIVLTIALAFTTVILTWVMALPIGIYSAVRQNSVGDYVFTFVGFIGLATPDFLLALILLWISFAVFDFSVGGLFSRQYVNAPWSLAKAWDLFQHMWIPAVVLGTSGTAGLIRVLRANLLDELRKPYVVTARAKGLPGWRTVLKYPVRVAINPFISGIGSMLPALVSGSVIVAVVLGLPTLGPLLLQALQFEDVPMIAAIIMLLAIMTVIGTLISDLLLVVVDPRITLTGSGRSGG